MASCAAGSSARTLNPWNYPAKDRSGRLDMIEAPHLGRLLEKIRGPAKSSAERLEFTRPLVLPTPTIDAQSQRKENEQ